MAGSICWRGWRRGWCATRRRAGTGEFATVGPWLFATGDALGDIGAAAFLVAALIACGLTLARHGRRALPSAVPTIVAALLFTRSHIYFPVGVGAMLLLAAGCGLLQRARLGGGGGGCERGRSPQRRGDTEDGSRKGTEQEAQRHSEGPERRIGLGPVRTGGLGGQRPFSGGFSAAAPPTYVAIIVRRCGPHPVTSTRYAGTRRAAPLPIRERGCVVGVGGGRINPHPGATRHPRPKGTRHPRREGIGVAGCWIAAVAGGHCACVGTAPPSSLSPVPPLCLCASCSVPLLSRSLRLRVSAVIVPRPDART